MNRFRTLKLLVALLCAVYLVSPARVFGAKLIAILAADTLDRSVGRFTSKDLIRLKAEMRQIARASGLTLELHTIHGTDFTAAKLSRTIRSISPGRDDVVFYYSCSHGFRTYTKRSQWPYLQLRGREGMDLGRIFQNLYSKGPRLLLVFAEACNNTVPDGAVRVVPLAPRRLKVGTGYRALFRKTRGAIICSSSRPGQYSWGRGDGGLFTYAFLNALHQESSSYSPSWSSLMKKATQPIYIQGNVQQPQYTTYRSPADLLASTSPGGSDRDRWTTPTSTTTGTGGTGSSWGGSGGGGSGWGAGGGGGAGWGGGGVVYIVLNGVNCDYALTTGGRYRSGAYLQHSGVNSRQLIRVPAGFQAIVLLTGNNNNLRVDRALRNKVTLGVTGVGNSVR